jgi:C4-dicarboxylate-specific signal transduction histidine kinase
MSNRQRERLNVIIIILLALVIFAADTITDFEVAVAVFYVGVVLVSVFLLSRRGVIAVWATCMVLSVVSFLFTSSGDHEAGLTNLLISSVAICVVTFLALKNFAATVAAQAARNELAHVARLTALGELTVSIAHEVNQPLAAIVNSANACARWLDGKSPNLTKARQSIQRIVDDAHRAGDVIARVRAMATRLPSQKEWLNVGDTVSDILGLCAGQLSENGVDTRVTLEEGLPPVLADRIQIQQVMLNLILNAIDAMAGEAPGFRLLEVAVERIGNTVVWSVKDNGIGLSGNDVSKVFDAFFTTKSSGLGIGLAISRTIVEAHGGRIWANPNAIGTTFLFSLPTFTAEVV